MNRGSIRKTRSINFVCSDEIWTWVWEQANKNKMSAGHVIRKLIEEKIEIQKVGK